jgi:hypothetical protein
MLADVLMLGRERQCEVFPPFSVGKMWVVLCVGGKHRGDQAGRSRCGQENREEQQLRWLSGFDLAIPTGHSLFLTSTCTALGCPNQHLSWELDCSILDI